MKPLPRIIEPFSRTGDEIAGRSADEIAFNLRDATNVSLMFNCEAQRPFPDVWTVFLGQPLSRVNLCHALAGVAKVYARLRRKAERVPTPHQRVLSFEAESNLGGHEA